MSNIIDANARRIRVLELGRQAVLLQIQMWELQKRLEGAILDGAEMDDRGSEEVLSWITMLAAAASLDVGAVYDQINDSHVEDLFRAVGVEQAPAPAASTAAFESLIVAYNQYAEQCRRNGAKPASYNEWRKS